MVWWRPPALQVRAASLLDSAVQVVLPGPEMTAAWPVQWRALQALRLSEERASRLRAALGAREQPQATEARSAQGRFVPLPTPQVPAPRVAAPTATLAAERWHILQSTE